MNFLREICPLVTNNEQKRTETCPHCSKITKDSDVKKELINNKNSFIVDKEMRKKMEYEFLWADDELTYRYFNNNEEARNFMREHEKHASMKLIKVVNLDTDEEITIN